MKQNMRIGNLLLLNQLEKKLKKKSLKSHNLKLKSKLFLITKSQMLLFLFSQKSIILNYRDKLLTSEEAKKKLNEYLSKNCKAEKKLWILSDDIISKWFLNNEEDDNNNAEEGTEGASKKKKEGKASVEEIW